MFFKSTLASLVLDNLAAMTGVLMSITTRYLHTNTAITKACHSTYIYDCLIIYRFDVYIGLYIYICVFAS